MGRVYKELDEKTCKKCGRTLPYNEEYFRQHVAFKSGLYNICRECTGGRFNLKPSAENYYVCRTCYKEFPLNSIYFRKDRNMRSGFKAHCRQCMSNGKVKIPLQEGNYRCKKCGKEYPYTLEYFLPNGKNKKLTSPCKFCRHDYNSNPEVRAKLNKIQKEKIKNSVGLKVMRSFRSRVHKALKRNVKYRKSFILLGCSIEFYKEYLNNLMSKEMNWENYGKLWDIDHIIPCSYFNLDTESEQLKCFHYTNTQPMFKKDNIAKLNRNCKKIIYKTSNFYEQFKDIIENNIELDER